MLSSDFFQFLYQLQVFIELEFLKLSLFEDEYFSLEIQFFLTA